MWCGYGVYNIAKAVCFVKWEKTILTKKTCFYFYLLKQIKKQKKVSHCFFKKVKKILTCFY